MRADVLDTATNESHGTTRRTPTRCRGPTRWSAPRRMSTQSVIQHAAPARIEPGVQQGGGAGVRHAARCNRPDEQRVGKATDRTESTSRSAISARAGCNPPYPRCTGSDGGAPSCTGAPPPCDKPHPPRPTRCLGLAHLARGAATAKKPASLRGLLRRRKASPHRGKLRRSVVFEKSANGLSF